MGIAAFQRSPAQAAVTLSAGYRAYVLGVLWLVALFRFVDLQIVAVLLESLRAEFAFSDIELALIGGLAFALFYGFLGLPIAWLADRCDRRAIIALAVGLWSFMTMLCGMAQGFLSLFLARMGVGIGEAGAYPPTASLLADYFPPERRARAFGVLASAIPAGVFAGFLIGGAVNELYGWRAAFQLVGLPGLLLALLVQFTVRELPRGFSEPAARLDLPESFSGAARALFRIPAYRHTVAGACLFTLGACGSGIWIPSWLIRHHGLGAMETGMWMAGLYGGGGLLGALAGGWLAQHWCGRLRSQAGYGYCCAFSLLALLPFACFVFLWPEPLPALCAHFAVTFLMHMNIGPVLAVIQNVAGLRRRATAQALNVLVSNVVALPLGPLIVGAASQFLTPRFGAAVLGYAILALLLTAWSWAALHFLLAARALRSEPPISR